LGKDGKITTAEVASLVAALAPAGQPLTQDQRSLVADVIVEQFKGDTAVPASALKDAGITFQDLPPATPVEVRLDEKGNEVIITAEVAIQVELLQDPGALLAEALTNPGAALAALGSVGADMSPQEREEAQKMVVAAVIAGNAAINAVGAAAAAAGGATGGSRSGGGGGNSGGGGASGDSKGVRRRRP
jgi:hypothetical protein